MTIHLTKTACSLLASLSIALVGITPAAASDIKQPNVLFILVDDMGYSDLGSFGGEIETPHLDRIADEGARFTQFYNSARCCPSRASLLTGLYPAQAGIPNFGGKLVDRCVTMGEVLRGAGYQTYAVGKWHVGHLPTDRGFDEFYGYTEAHSQNQWDPERYIRLPEGRAKEINPAEGEFYATDVFTDYAIRFLEEAQASEAPFFLYLAHSSPHFPIQAPKETIDHYYERYMAGWDVLREERFERQQALGLAEDSWVLTERSIVPLDEVAQLSGQQNPAWDSLPIARQKDLARRMATYAAMVHHVDQGIGRIVKTLEQLGELDDTLIVFTSDNGACYEWDPFGFDGKSRRKVKILYTDETMDRFGQAGTYASVGSAWSTLSNTPFRMYKHFTHEGGVCSPLLISWPAGLGQESRWVRTPSHLIDLMPTLCEATGATYPETYNGHTITPEEGRSLLPAARGAAVENRPFGIQHQGACAWRDGDWKIVLGKRMPTEPTWELYNLADDRSEAINLAEQHPEKVEEMIEAYETWFNRTRKSKRKK